MQTINPTDFTYKRHLFEQFISFKELPTRLKIRFGGSAASNNISKIYILRLLSQTNKTLPPLLGTDTFALLIPLI